jgi:membrane protease YdiL (CAAX protease family)
MTENSSKLLHPSLQFLTFICITIGIIFAGNIFGAAIVMAFYGVDTLMAVAKLDLTSPGVVNALWIIQVAGTTLPIIGAALIFAYLTVKNPQEYLKASFKFNWLLLVIVFCVMLISSPLIELLSNVNQKMVLPHFLDGLQKTFREWEDQAKKVTDVLLQMPTVFSMILKLVFVGLLTAIVEEFMFRGVIQTIFIKWFKNPHAAVWITATLFSAFHMEFFGFLPRLLLGALFGYFVVWSGSIWTSVWAHFINNGTAVVVTYLYQNKMIKFNPDDQHVFNWVSYAFSLIIVLFLLYLYRNIATGKVKAAVL